MERRKLVGLIDNYTDQLSVRDIHKADWPEKFADYLIANGVLVQEGRPLEAFLHPIDTYKGLKTKYLVFKADTGAKVDNCFILRPGKDPVAIEALRAYASATDNEILAEDIYNWVGRGKQEAPNET